MFAHAFPCPAGFAQTGHMPFIAHALGSGVHHTLFLFSYNIVVFVEDLRLYFACGRRVVEDTSNKKGSCSARHKGGYMARGRKTSLTIRLTPAQRQTLLEWQRSTTIPAGRARRGRIILLMADRGADLPDCRHGGDQPAFCLQVGRSALCTQGWRGWPTNQAVATRTCCGSLLCRSSTTWARDVHVHEGYKFSGTAQLLCPESNLLILHDVCRPNTVG